MDPNKPIAKEGKAEVDRPSTIPENLQSSAQRTETTNSNNWTESQRHSQPAAAISSAVNSSIPSTKEPSSKSCSSKSPGSSTICDNPSVASKPIKRRAREGAASASTGSRKNTSLETTKRCEEASDDIDTTTITKNGDSTDKVKKMRHNTFLSGETRQHSETTVCSPSSLDKAVSATESGNGASKQLPLPSLCWDLESALHYVVQWSKKDPPECREHLVPTITKNQSQYTQHPPYVTFRLAHAGDTATLAQLIRSQQQEQELTLNEKASDQQPCVSSKKMPPDLLKNTAAFKEKPAGGSPSHSPVSLLSPNQTSSPKAATINPKHPSVSSPPSAALSSWEVWLADGLGDEDTPPGCFVLLAEVHVTTMPETVNAKASNNEHSPSSPTTTCTQISACALVTSAWEEATAQRVLRVEWWHVAKEDESDSAAASLAAILSRKLWLRLATVALLTHSQVRMLQQHPTDESGGNREGKSNWSTRIKP